MLYWENMDNQRIKGRWAQIFSELREENFQWMLDCLISIEVILESRREFVLPLPDIRGILPYAPFLVLRQFGRRKLYPKKRTMGLMHTILEMIECMVHLKCSENGNVPSVWIKKPSSLTNSMLYMTRVKSMVEKGHTKCLFPNPG